MTKQFLDNIFYLFYLKNNDSVDLNYYFIINNTDIQNCDFQICGLLNVNTYRLCIKCQTLINLIMYL